MKIELCPDLPEEVIKLAVELAELAESYGWQEWELLDVASSSVVESLRKQNETLLQTNKELNGKLKAIHEIIGNSYCPYDFVQKEPGEVGGGYFLNTMSH